MYDEEEPTLGNIARELTTKGYWERARARQRSSKTVWDLIFMPVMFACIGLCWIAFGKFFWWFHVLLYPAVPGASKR
jgi:hypothetical protein